MKYAALTLLLTGTLAACGGGDDDAPAYEIAETPLAGTVGGKPWTFVKGDATPMMFGDERELQIDLFPVDFETCGWDTPIASEILGTFPAEVGEYELSTGLNVTFVVDHENYWAIDGALVIDEVTDTKIRGGLHAIAKHDPGNEIDGQFEIDICPPGPPGS
jgi:hypothetical protein